jgi:hypothetical protein
MGKLGKKGLWSFLPNQHAKVYSLVHLQFICLFMTCTDSKYWWPAAPYLRELDEHKRLTPDGA